MIAKIAWNDITLPTIINCFKKCGFYEKRTLIEVEAESEDNDGDDGEKVWGIYCSLANKDCGTFQEYVEADDSLQTTFEMNLDLINKKIIDEINNGDEGSETETEIDEPNEENKEISIHQVKSSIELIKKFVLNHQKVNENLSLIDKLENNIIENHISTSKQTLITDFFNN